MTIAEQFELALEFMLLGMGVVFTFLTLLVLAVKWMGYLVQRAECTTTGVEGAAITAAAVTSQEELTAVIAAAVQQYRRERSPERR